MVLDWFDRAELRQFTQLRFVQRSELFQDLQRDRRTDAGVAGQVEPALTEVAVHDFHGDADTGGVGTERTGQQTDGLVAFRAAFADDLPRTNLHQAAIEFCRAADHFGMCCHGGGDLPARISAHFW